MDSGLRSPTHNEDKVHDPVTTIAWKNVALRRTYLSLLKAGGLQTLIDVSAVQVEALLHDSHGSQHLALVVNQQTTLDLGEGRNDLYTLLTTVKYESGSRKLHTSKSRGSGRLETKPDLPWFCSAKERATKMSSDS